MKCKRTAIFADVFPYEEGKGYEDGFELFSKVVTNGHVVTEGLIQFKNAEGNLVCPFVRNRRGYTFIREGDYIIREGDEKHVCGADKFHKRFQRKE